MSLETNLRGRLRNTSLPISSALLPLHEAVVNSIHAIEECKPAPSPGVVRITIVRDPQTALQVQAQAHASETPIIGFEIRDNGVGFTDENMASFQTLDSEYKASLGGRGVGRLLWLKAFDSVAVESVYDDMRRQRKRRSFRFDQSNGVSVDELTDAGGEERGTQVALSGFFARYRDASPKSTSTIGRHIVEHCLWYFVRAGGAPHITITDDEGTVSLDDLYHELMLSSSSPESLQLNGTYLDLTHVKLSPASSRTHSIAFCAANRLVTRENIRGRIPGLFGTLHDQAVDFVYNCYVSSPVLDESVRSERTGFDIEDEAATLFGSHNVTRKDITDAVLQSARTYLKPYLDEQMRLGRERVETFVSNKAPQYRPLLGHIPDDQLVVDPDSTDNDLELHLHKHKAELEGKLLADGHDVLALLEHEDIDDYRERVQEYLEMAGDIKKSDLAGYVSHRRVIIDMLERAIRRSSDGKYAREETVHQLIMPMRKDSNEVFSDSCNLWLIDERLAFHNYLASDKPLSAMPITGDSSGKEPDLVVLNVFDNPVLVSDSDTQPLAALVVVELKRPMRDDAAEGESKDPIEQALTYLQRIRDGRVRTASGRPIGGAQSVPGFCYVICDLTATIEHRCKMHDATRTSDGLGYFFYQSNFNAYVEVLSFDRLVKGAKERNRSFFDKLGLPTT